LTHCGGPFDRPSPAQTSILDREIEQLQRRVIVRETAARFDDLAQRAVQRLDRVGGVDHLANAWREGEEWHDVVPGSPPGGSDRRIAFAPFGLELLEASKRSVGILSPIDQLNRRQDSLAVLPGHEGQAVADQVHDASFGQRPPQSLKSE